MRKKVYLCEKSAIKVIGQVYVFIFLTKSKNIQRIIPALQERNTFKKRKNKTSFNHYNQLKTFSETKDLNS